jgi:hypothetical protein
MSGLPCLLGTGRKHFFSEEKKQKTFSFWRSSLPKQRRKQKFFGSFFQKRTPSFLVALPFFLAPKLGDWKALEKGDWNSCPSGRVNVRSMG